LPIPKPPPTRFTGGRVLDRHHAAGHHDHAAPQRRSRGSEFPASQANAFTGSPITSLTVPLPISRSFDRQSALSTRAKSARPPLVGGRPDDGPGTPPHCRPPSPLHQDAGSRSADPRSFDRGRSAFRPRRQYARHHRCGMSSPRRRTIIPLAWTPCGRIEGAKLRPAGHAPRARRSRVARLRAAAEPLHSGVSDRSCSRRCTTGLSASSIFLKQAPESHNPHQGSAV